MKRIFIASALSPKLPEGWNGTPAETLLERQRIFQENLSNARAFCRWAFTTKHVRAFAPHLLYTQYLDEFSNVERRAGIMAGIEDLKECQGMLAFMPMDGKLTSGMSIEVKEAQIHGIPITYIPYEEWSTWVKDYAPRHA